MSEHKPNETGLHCSCGLPVYGNNEHVQRLFVDLAAAEARADELAKHCETHENIIESLTRDQMANKHWKSEWEQSYPALLQAQQRAEAAESQIRAQAEALSDSEQRVAGLMDALQLVQDEITSAGETGTEIAISDGEHQIIRAALATEPSAAELSHAPNRADKRAVEEEPES